MTKQMQQNLIAMVIFLGMTIFVYFKYLISPMEIKYKETVDKLKQTNSKLTEMKRRAQELPKLQMEMKLLKEEVAVLEKRLPKEKGIQDLLRTITKTAQEYDLSVSNFAPGRIVTKANYNEIPFTINLKGSFHRLAQFLTDLGQESRILSARKLNLSANSGTKDSNITINANFEIIAYTFKG